MRTARSALSRRWHAITKPRPTVFRDCLTATRTSWQQTTAHGLAGRMTSKKEPHCHPWLAHDAHAVLYFLKDDSEDHHRQMTLEYVSDVLGLNTSKAYGLLDISMHNYAAGLNFAPREFAIVPFGFEMGSLCDYNDASQVADLLMKAGFEGVFHDYRKTPADTPQPETFSSATDTTTPWPTYSQPHIPGLIFPPTLEARHPAAFTLTLPSYTHIPLITLMQCYSNHVAKFPVVSYLVARRVHDVAACFTCIIQYLNTYRTK